jgi:hypothetical protein
MSWLSRSLVCAPLWLAACDFHFDDFYAATPDVSPDASMPSTSGDPAGATATSSRRDAAAVDTGDAAAPPEDGLPGSVEEDAGQLGDPCANADAGLCACDASACAALDAGSPVAPPGSTPATVPVTPTPEPIVGLRLRYDFTGQGPTLQDRAGSAHGSLLGGAQLDGSGALTLDGSDDYASIPGDVLASLESVTLVAWVMSTGPTCWQRVFDIGVTLGTPGELMNDVLLAGELFLTTDACPDTRMAVVARNLMARQEARSPMELARNRPVQLAAVIDGMRQTLTLYIDGVRANETGSTLPLRSLSGGTFWLGRSLWRQDPYARLRFDEFRLYDRALGAEQLAELARRGADVP